MEIANEVKNYILKKFFASSIYQENYYCLNEDDKRIDAPFNDGCSYKRLKINHYFCKSQREYINKKNRGLSDHTYNLKRTMVVFIHTIRMIFMVI